MTTSESKSSVLKRPAAAQKDAIFGIENNALRQSAAGAKLLKNVLAIDIGGTSVKLLVTGQTERRSFPSGPTLTPKQMLSDIKRTTEDWTYESVSIGYPGPVRRDRPIANPKNLGAGWVGFDFTAAFGRPVKVLNDAAVQALGAYKGGKMLFLGLGTGLGTTLLVDNIVVPMELAHLPYRKATFEDYVGRAALDRNGKKQWRLDVAEVVGRLITALQPDDVVLGGGNVKKLDALPPGCRAGNNSDAFRGGFRLWGRDDALP
jgi:polyphosphate glucokinase